MTMKNDGSCRHSPPLARISCRQTAADPSRIGRRMDRTDLSLCRSLLFLPASNPRAIEKARTLAADMVVLDLEDAVKAEDKAAAREAAVAATQEGFGGRPVAIRVNPTGSRALRRGRRRGPAQRRRFHRPRQGGERQAGARCRLADGQAGAGDDRDAARGARRGGDRAGLARA